MLKILHSKKYTNIVFVIFALNQKSIKNEKFIKTIYAINFFVCCM